MKRMNLVAGETWLVPSMVHTRSVGGKGTVYIEFATAGWSSLSECHHQQLRSTIIVQITPLEREGLLRSLQIAQQRGLIPHIVEPPAQSKAN